MCVSICLWLWLRSVFGLEGLHMSLVVAEMCLCVHVSVSVCKYVCGCGRDVFIWGECVCICMCIHISKVVDEMCVCTHIYQYITPGSRPSMVSILCLFVAGRFFVRQKNW